MFGAALLGGCGAQQKNGGEGTDWQWNPIAIFRQSNTEMIGTKAMMWHDKIWAGKEKPAPAFLSRLIRNSHMTGHLGTHEERRSITATRNAHVSDIE